jgi:hypothetical protein
VSIKRPTLEDGRCPANARCIWSGQAVVRFVVNMRDAYMAFTMILNPGEESRMMFRDFEIELREVNPFPGLGAEGEEPSVELKFTRRL